MRCSRSPVPALSLLAALTLSACGGTDGAQATGTDGGAEPLEVVVGFYPYEFVAQRVGGGDVRVRNLTDPGVEPHDLELSPQQVARLAEADLVVYSAGFQPAVDEAVEQQAADEAFDVLTAVELRKYEESGHSEEEGAHSEEEGAPAEEGEAAHGEEGHDHAGEDPHVWLDPTRLSTIADAVAEQLAERAPERAEEIRARADELKDELAALDDELQQGLSSCARTEMVTSHDAFGYLADRYGLEQVAISLSPEEEPSTRRLAEVAEFAEERGVTTIFFEELVSPRVADSLAREVGAQTAVLTPLEGPPDDGDYLDAMRTNLATLQAALDCA